MIVIDLQYCASHGHHEHHCWSSLVNYCRETESEGQHQTDIATRPFFARPSDWMDLGLVNNQKHCTVCLDLELHHCVPSIATSHYVRSVLCMCNPNRCDVELLSTHHVINQHVHR